MSSEQIEKAAKEYSVTEKYLMDAAEFVHLELHKLKSKDRRGKVWMFFDFTERRVIRED